MIAGNYKEEWKKCNQGAPCPFGQGDIWPLKNNKNFQMK